MGSNHQLRSFKFYRKNEEEVILEIILKGVMPMPNRSFKFYRKNEEEVMKSLGLKPTKNSGSGWV